MYNLKMDNGSWALLPSESTVDYSLSSSGYEYQIDAGEDFNCYFDTDQQQSKFSLQIKWEAINGTGTIALKSSMNNTDYDDVTDDDDTAITVSVTGSDTSYTINHNVAPLGLIKVNYDAGTNSAGTISLSLRY